MEAYGREKFGRGQIAQRLVGTDRVVDGLPGSEEDFGETERQFSGGQAPNQITLRWLSELSKPARVDH
jgi:hypothetical protein